MNIFEKMKIRRDNKLIQIIFFCSVFSVTLFFIIRNFYFNQFKYIYKFNIILLLYFVIASIFLYFILFKIKKEIFNKYSSLIFFILCFIFLLFWIPFGTDFTDDGKQLSTAWNIFNGTVEHKYNLYKYGSWFCNGLWLNIIGKPFMLWQRLGGVIVMSLIALFSYMISKKYLNNLYSFIVSFILLFYVICRNHPETIIDHNNFPTLLVIISLFFLISYIKSEKKYILKPVLLIISSSFILISILMRFTHIFILVFPVLFFIIYTVKKQIKFKKSLLSIFWFYLPILLIIGVIILVSLVSNQIKSSYLINAVDNVVNRLMTLKTIFSIDFIKLNYMELKSVSYVAFLLKRYLRDFVYISILGIIFFIGLFVGEILYKRINKIKFYNIYIDYLLFVIIGILLFIFLLLKPWMWYKAVFGFIISYIVILKIRKIKFKEEYFYIFWGIILIFISFVGSNSSFRHSVPAGAVFILFSFIAVYNFKNKKLINENKMRFLNKFTILFFIVLFFIAGYKKFFDDNKRDMPFFYLTHMYSSPELFGIFGNETRVKSVDGVISAAKKNIKKENTILCFNNIPLLYYILDKDYLLNDPWTIHLYLNGLKNGMEKLKNENQKPDFIIFSEKTALEKNWPDITHRYNERKKEHFLYILEYVEKNNYNVIYQKNNFIIFKNEKN